MANCTKCEVTLSEGNTHHAMGGKCKWCDKCWFKYHEQKSAQK